MGSAATTSLPMPSLVNKSLTLKVTWGMVQAWVAKKLVNVTFYEFLRCPFIALAPLFHEKRDI